MRTVFNFLSRALCALVLCAGVVFISCQKDPVDEGDKPEVQSDTTFVTLEKVTATTATFSGHLSVEASDIPSSQVMVYYSDAAEFKLEDATGVSTEQFDSDQNFKIVLNNLKPAAKYSYCVYIKVNEEKTYGETLTFTTSTLKADLTARDSVVITTEPVFMEFYGNISGLSEEDKPNIEVGVMYSTEIDGLESPLDRVKSPALEVAEDGSFTVTVEEPLPIDAIYYYCSYIKREWDYILGDVKVLKVFQPGSEQTKLDMSTAIDLSSDGTANCYAVAAPGVYKFKTVKGNSSVSVGDVRLGAVLWESFGTTTKPNVNDLIEAVYYKDDYIAFKVGDPFKTGNAVIAAKDKAGEIIWSWHIWLTDGIPQAQAYFKESGGEAFGAFMDRNLGAASATPGGEGTLGLYYQWGRKDPFLGSSSLSGYVKTESTIDWPEKALSTPEIGTIPYTISHPTQFIYNDLKPQDWEYKEEDVIDTERWTLLNKEKSIYDPCPPGWRVPDGGTDGLWQTRGFISCVPDAEKCGSDMGDWFFNESLWYPFTGKVDPGKGPNEVNGVGSHGCYWTAKTEQIYVYYLRVEGTGATATYALTCSCALSVRCCRD